MVAVIEERPDAVVELVLNFIHLPDDSHGAEGCLLPDVRVRGLHHLLYLPGQGTAHLGAGDVAQSAEREAVDILIVMAHVVLDRICHEHQHLSVLVKELSKAQVAHSLLRELARGDELQALHLAKVRGVAHHVDKEQLRDVPVPELVVIFLEGRADQRTLACNDGALFRGGLASADAADQLTELDRHAAKGGVWARAGSGHSSLGLAPRLRSKRRPSQPCSAAVRTRRLGAKT
mmetsp:Transcript_85937/g.184185  ORF Transcript_85937/g.184185 Transcript_85937/m.184185 type:complete len:233 (+) Transcript_85937:1625-2323(+)